MLAQRRTPLPSPQILGTMEWPGSSDALFIGDWSDPNTAAAGWSHPAIATFRHSSSALLLSTPPILIDAASHASVDSTAGFLWPTPIADIDRSALVPTLSDGGDSSTASPSSDLSSDDDSNSLYLANSEDPFMVGSGSAATDLDFSDDSSSSSSISNYASPAASDDLGSGADAAMTPAPADIPAITVGAKSASARAPLSAARPRAPLPARPAARPAASRPKPTSSGGQFGRPLRRGKTLTKEEYEARLERARVRQEKNRAAAKKCRLRKQEHYKELLVDVKVLHDENSQLRQTVANLIAHLEANGLAASADALAMLSC